MGRQRGLGFQRAGRHPVVDHRDAGDMGGGRDGGIHRGRVAVAPMHAQVAAMLIVNRRCVWRGSGGEVDGDRQRLHLQFHQFGGVAGLLQGLGDHRGDGLAHIAHPVRRQGRSMRNEGRCAIHTFELGDAGQPAEAGQVRAAVHRQHAGRPPRRVHADAHDAAVRMGRAAERDPRLTGQFKIVREAAAAGDEAWVFNAGNGLADAELGGRASHATAAKRISKGRGAPSLRRHGGGDAY